MKKVLCEHPRRGSSTPSAKTGRKMRTDLDWDSGDYDWGPTRVKVGRHPDRHCYWYYDKELADYLSPLENYLRSNAGRKWDDVYSDICAQADSRSVLGHHLRQHVGYLVDQTDHRLSWRCYGFFVEDGILCYKPWKRWRMFEASGDVTRINLGDGVWYERWDSCYVTEGCHCRFITPSEPWGTRRVWEAVRPGSRIQRQSGFNRPKCVHGRVGEVQQSLWYELIYATEDREPRVIEHATATESERIRYDLKTVDSSVIIERPMTDLKRIGMHQANKKTLRAIRAFLRKEEDRAA